MHSKFSHTMVCTFPPWLASPLPGPQNEASGCKCNIWLNCMISHPEIGNTIWSNYFVKTFSQTCLQKKKWAANQDTTSPQKFKWLMAQAKTLGLTLVVFSTHQILLLNQLSKMTKNCMWLHCAGLHFDYNYSFIIHWLLKMKFRKSCSFLLTSGCHTSNISNTLFLSSPLLSLHSCHTVCT